MKLILALVAISLFELTYGQLAKTSYDALKGKLITLKSHHGKYVRAEENGQADAKSESRGQTALWKVELLGNFGIALKSFHKRYLGVGNRGRVKANRVKRSPMMIFKINFLSSSTKVTFRSYHGKYLSATEDGRVIAIRGKVGDTEKFTITETFNDPENSYAGCIDALTEGEVKCDEKTEKYRTVDGTCNNKNNPILGAGFTPFRRLLPSSYADDADSPVGAPGYNSEDTPTAKEVSDTVFGVESETDNNDLHSSLSTMYMTFGQFLDHDVGLTPHDRCEVANCLAGKDSVTFKHPCFPIKYVRNISDSRCMQFARSIAACNTKNNKRQQINVLSSFIDASQVYGSTVEHNKELRDGPGPKMKITTAGLLPIDPLSNHCAGGCSLVGDLRGDENIALHSMHTLWVREHNRVVNGLKKLENGWGNEKLYQEARKIVIAEWQHIVYEEYLPVITKLEDYDGYKDNINASITNVFATAAFRYGHSLVPNSFSQCDKNFDFAYEDINLRETFFNTTTVRERGIEPTLLGELRNTSMKVDASFARVLSRKLFVPLGDKVHELDLTALNIQRGRDHGLPTYGQWRKYCKLPNVKQFKALKKYIPSKTVEKFEKVYKHPNDIDLFAAAVAENHAEGLKVGPTLACLFKEQFTALRDGDRFFYKADGLFTKDQLEAIEKVTMSSILCANLNDVVSIQKKALQIFSEDNKRNMCASENIPSLNLDEWKIHE